jgi:hypothetical protein
MRLHLRVLVVSLLLAVLAACAPDVGTGREAGPDWLLGTWALAHDPDGDPRDWLEFADNGALTVRAPDGREFAGEWRLDGDTVRMTLVVDGRRLGIDLVAAAARDRLATETGAWYAREPAAAP